MCNLYSVTCSQAAIRELARAFRDLTGNLAPLPAIFPDQVAPVVRTGSDGVRELDMMRWGFPPPTHVTGGAVTNIRNTTSNWWRPWLTKPESRCLVPVTSFCEYDHRGGKPVPTWFAQDETRAPFFFAGVWRGWEGTRGTKTAPVTGWHQVFAFLTTEPNSVVAPVHPKAMPVLLLTEADRETWLTGALENALALQRPAPDDALRTVAKGLKQDAYRWKGRTTSPTNAMDFPV